MFSEFAIRARLKTMRLYFSRVPAESAYLRLRRRPLFSKSESRRSLLMRPSTLRLNGPRVHDFPRLELPLLWIAQLTTLTLGLLWTQLQGCLKPVTVLSLSWRAERESMNEDRLFQRALVEFERVFVRLRGRLEALPRH
jgi:hypothetical protein